MLQVPLYLFRFLLSSPYFFFRMPLLNIILVPKKSSCTMFDCNYQIYIPISNMVFVKLIPNLFFLSYKTSRNMHNFLNFPIINELSCILICHEMTFLSSNKETVQVKTFKLPSDYQNIR